MRESEGVGQTQQEAEAQAAMDEAALLAARQEVKQAVQAGVVIEMNGENAAAILDGNMNIFTKVDSPPSPPLPHSFPFPYPDVGVLSKHGPAVTDPDKSRIPHPQTTRAVFHVVVWH